MHPLLQMASPTNLRAAKLVTGMWSISFPLWIPPRSVWAIVWCHNVWIGSTTCFQIVATPSNYDPRQSTQCHAKPIITVHHAWWCSRRSIVRQDVSRCGSATFHQASISTLCLSQLNKGWILYLSMATVDFCWNLRCIPCHPGMGISTQSWWQHLCCRERNSNTLIDVRFCFVT